ncbi:ribonuclease E/G, partial [Rudaea sp.]|uniref:ribonuclease E/G n=1 Tax=Rudaea sp. TaxID=2136325 RepID=UPI002ED58B91
MSEEILINVTPRETRVGVVENGVLQEVHVERALKRGYVGNIYRGRVSRVMPGMQAAFVEVGLERAAFLHANDIVRSAPAANGDGHEGENGEVVALPTPPISELVHEGQDIIVQVVKDPIGSKGARLTTHLSIPSRYLVLLPYAKMIGVSVRIEDEAERVRLKELVAALTQPEVAVAGDASAAQPAALGPQLGYIVRTNAEGASREALADDVAYLGRVWRVVQENMRRVEPRARVYEELALPLRAL